MLRGFALAVGPLLLLTFACSQDGQEITESPGPATATRAHTGPQPATVTATQSAEIVNLGFVDWYLPAADSLDTLTRGYEVVLGRVTGIALPFDPRVGYGGVAPETAPPGHPKSSYKPTEEEIQRPPGRLFTVFAVEVIDPGSSNLAQGDTINVGQSAGLWEGKQYQDEGNPPLVTGMTYLLAIMPSETVEGLVGSGYFMGPPFTSFRIVAGAVQPLDAAWDYLPAVRELEGKPAQGALASILDARRRAPATPSVATE